MEIEQLRAGDYVKVTDPVESEYFHNRIGFVSAPFIDNTGVIMLDDQKYYDDTYKIWGIPNEWLEKVTEEEAMLWKLSH